VINRLGIEGQVEGGIAQGIGYALSEELKVEGGRILNPSFTDYKLFTTTDLPELKIAFVETDDPAGPHGAKGIGEAPMIPVAPAIANAIFDATGVRITELPMTPERVLAKLKEGREGAKHAGTGHPSARKHHGTQNSSMHGHRTKSSEEQNHGTQGGGRNR
jgi:CO/xanthine dehydrogenase Mo-binding subunit